jgi:hypothetical protein
MRAGIVFLLLLLIDLAQISLNICLMGKEKRTKLFKLLNILKSKVIKMGRSYNIQC